MFYLLQDALTQLRWVADVSGAVVDLGNPWIAQTVHRWLEINHRPAQS